MNADDQDSSKRSTRQTLAYVVIGLSAVGIVLIAALAIGFADDRERGDTTRLVFTSMLPLFGTWVGTVLAFYFSRENLEAATASTLSTLRLSGGLDDRTPVRDVMIPVGSIKAVTIAAGQDASSVKLADIVAAMKEHGFKRIPVLGSGGEALFVVHDSTINEFKNTLSKDPTDAAAFTETLADLVANGDLKALVEAFAFVGQDAVLADARTAMRSTKGANDVFVTAGGKPTEPIVGWLTNTDMAALE